MNKNVFFKSLAAIFVFVFTNLCYGEEMPSVKQLKESVANINLPGDDIAALKIDMKMNLPLPMQIVVQLRYLKPDQYSIHVFDGSDNTPMLVVADKMAMINDPVSESLMLVASAGVAFDLAPQGDQYTANFAFNLPVDNRINDRIKMDFESLFGRVCIDEKLEVIEPGIMKYSGKTKQKSFCSAVFVASPSISLSSLSLFVEGEKEPVLEFTRISTLPFKLKNEFTFPKKELENSGVKFQKIENAGMLDTMMIISAVMKAVFSRAALKNAKLRAEIEKSLSIKPDWEKMQENDAARNEILKELFKPLKD
ncbi:MAG: hypothetical protein Kow0029_22130 [Candidatus Rifleibacteriota bacterium]